MRCPFAIGFNTALETRCMLSSGHEGQHKGRGLPEFAYQRIIWLPGDHREFRSDREDQHAWDGSVPR